MTRKMAWAGIGIGIALIATWYAATRTTLILAYRAGTLSQVQGLCDSNLGRLARALSVQGATDCGHIDSLSTWCNAAGFAGLLLAVACAAWLIYQSRRGATPAVDSGVRPRPS